MKTVVLQSFRTRDVPGWLSQAMTGVRAWAESRGWDYAFMDDAFFSLAPDWVRERCAGNVYALTDVCRLVWAQRMLERGYERVVWADADMLVFDPEGFDLPEGAGHGFARELFLAVHPGRAPQAHHGVNNALMLFEHGDGLLEAYLDAAHASLRGLPPGPVPRVALGPDLLRRLAARQPLNTIEGVGLFSMAVMQSVAAGGGALWQEYLRLSPTPPRAANLCHFLRDHTAPTHRPTFDRIYETAVARLMATRGRITP